MLPAGQDTLPLRILIVQLLSEVLHTVSETLLLLFLQRVAHLAEQPRRYHHINRVIHPSLDVARVIRLAGEVVDQYSADVRVLQTTVPIEKSGQSPSDELQPLHLLSVTLTLLLYAAPRQSPQLSHCRCQLYCGRWNAPVVLHTI